ncbi:hypothetical protein RYX36_022399 [Vicia faba]
MYTTPLYAAIASLIHNKNNSLEEKFIETLKLMEHKYGGKYYVTSKDSSLLYPGTLYLTKVVGRI